LDEGHLLEPVDAELVRTYELYPVLAQHYSREAAFRQKIWGSQPPDGNAGARYLRPQAAARWWRRKEKLPADTATEIPKAIENAMTIGFDEFSGQVRAYLTADYQEY